MLSYYWVKDRIPTLTQEKSFQTLGQKDHVNLTQHTIRWRVFLQKCLKVVQAIEDESHPIYYIMQFTCKKMINASRIATFQNFHNNIKVEYMKFLEKCPIT
jgi:hypothetical protein